VNVHVVSGGLSMIACRVAASAASLQPSLVVSNPARSRSTTTSPFSPAAPWWMWEMVTRVDVRDAHLPARRPGLGVEDHGGRCRCHPHRLRRCRPGSRSGSSRPPSPCPPAPGWRPGRARRPARGLVEGYASGHSLRGTRAPGGRIGDSFRFRRLLRVPWTRRVTRHVVAGRGRRSCCGGRRGAAAGGVRSGCGAPPPTSGAGRTRRARRAPAVRRLALHAPGRRATARRVPGTATGRSPSSSTPPSPASADAAPGPWRLVRHVHGHGRGADRVREGDRLARRAVETRDGDG